MNRKPDAYIAISARDYLRERGAVEAWRSFSTESQAEQSQGTVQFGSPDSRGLGRASTSLQWRWCTHPFTLVISLTATKRDFLSHPSPHLRPSANFFLFSASPWGSDIFSIDDVVSRLWYKLRRPHVLLYLFFGNCAFSFSVNKVGRFIGDRFVISEKKYRIRRQFFVV